MEIRALLIFIHSLLTVGGPHNMNRKLSNLTVVKRGSYFIFTMILMKLKSCNEICAGKNITSVLHLSF